MGLSTGCVPVERLRCPQAFSDNSIERRKTERQRPYTGQRDEKQSDNEKKTKFYRRAEKRTEESLLEVQGEMPKRENRTATKGTRDENNDGNGLATGNGRRCTMRARPCGESECQAFRAEHGDAEIGSDICILCGGEGPMCDWYEDMSDEESDEWWNGGAND